MPPKRQPPLEPGEVKTNDQEFVDIMISLAEKTRDLLGITPQAAFIDDDLGAMGRIVSCLLRQVTGNAAKAGNTLTNPKPPAEPVALSPGPSKSKPAPPPKPSPNGFQLARPFQDMALRGMSSSGNVNYPPFYTTPETIPMDDSDIDIVYVETTINPNIRETPIAIKSDPDQDLEDPLQLIIPIARKVINLDDDEEDEEQALAAAPVDDDEPKLLPITYIAAPSTPDIPPIEPVDLDFEVEDIENIKQNDADFDNMAVMEYEGGTGNVVESQALKDETMNNVYEDW
ncbi:hypothetical protein BDD12DRAFT_928382 [Trichophaea hybrida]|nr:hypothetical protein BDD12DRAFT_928382 [Trichophaea hybrida]